MNELLPCPFCGSGANLERRPDTDRYVCVCQNDDCHASPIIVGRSKDEAIARWNTRSYGCEAPLENPRDRRDRFAAAALQGLLARYGDDGPKDVAAGLAVGFADALIAALDKQP